jgi:anti-anti-sigma factor
MSAAGTAPLHISTTEDGLRLEGEVDISNSPQLADALATASARGGDVVLDMTELRFMDSTGIQTLIRAGKTMAPDSELVLHHPTPLVLNVLRLIRADGMPGLRVVEAPG